MHSYELRMSDIITDYHLRGFIKYHKLEIECYGPLFPNNLNALSECINSSWINL